MFAVWINRLATLADTGEWKPNFLFLPIHYVRIYRVNFMRKMYAIEMQMYFSDKLKLSLCAEREAGIVN